MTDANWKRFERRVAQRCGGNRISVSDRKTDLDVDHPYLGIECKYRAKLPQYLKDWYAQAKRGSIDHRIPVVVMGEKSNSDMYALLDFDDLTMLLVHAIHGFESDGGDIINYGGTD
jgi:hypothetical protein